MNMLKQCGLELTFLISDLIRSRLSRISLSPQYLQDAFLRQAFVNYAGVGQIILLLIQIGTWQK